ncbi:MAG: SDR family NAD(P)-dependent oxidoreductase [Actinobacteria bacterium]|nr:SDR family NAD(P)-dependent oxidoreductase [Actinomycetota bacterium]
MSGLPLHGQVAAITGGGTGVGAAAAASLARRGARLVITGRREDRLRSVADALETEVEVLAADITGPETSALVVDRAIEQFGRLDIVVHAAGIFEKRPIEETDDAFWHRTLDVNLSAVVALTRAAWPALRRSAGQVVLISSVAAVQGFSDNTAYAASKGGMNAIGEVFREEGRADGIRILTICPAQIDTELWDGKAPDSVRGRMMRSSGVGEVVASLTASDRSIDFAPVTIRPPSNPWLADV